MDRYEHVKDIGYGYIGVAKLMREKKTQDLVAVKYIQRGETIDKNVERELVNHRLLRHPNIVRFKEVYLTPTHLAIAMEYAGGGELFKRICQAGRFTEKEASFFFRQLISGITYCHQMQICHRDLKLENLLVEDGSPTPRLKICDFGFSKSSVLHSEPNSIVGTPAYMAPEVLLSKKDYDGKIADVWCCGVTLYVMLVGSYPFEDPRDPTNFRKTILRILKVHYSIPEYVHLSSECRHLLSKIFVANPAKRISIAEIQKHPWFVKNLQRDQQAEATKEDHTNEEDEDETTQSVEEIMRIVQEGRNVDVCHSIGPFLDDEDDDEDSNIPESIGEFVCAI